MSRVRVTLKDGAVREFPPTVAWAGLDYAVRYEGAFVIVMNTDDRSTTSFPAADVKEVATAPNRARF